MARAASKATAKQERLEVEGSKALIPESQH